jgi:hypothetical protein
MVIKNVSMVSDYRHQFHRILGKSSYAELVKSIERKLTELHTSPSFSGVAELSELPKEI